MSNEKNLDFGYNGNSIHIASGAEKHRIDPGQYLGGDDYEGIFNQFVEIYDNAVDEMVEWYAMLHDDDHYGPELNGEKLPPLELNIEVMNDWTIVIDDMGRGIPCDRPVDDKGNPIEGSEPAIFPIFENDSAGGKAVHAQGGYKNGTAGMHGAGAAVSKSCTRKFDVVTRSGPSKGVFKVKYVNGDREKEVGDNGLVRIGDLSYEHPIEKYRQYHIPYTGTRIEYLFDERVLTPTAKGQPVDPYYEHELIERIHHSLLGIKDRDCIKVNFTFKGETTVITPYDMTPESIVGCDVNDPHGTDNCIHFNVHSAPTAVGTKSEFSAEIYINIDENRLYFEDTTIVNRLKMKSSTSSEVLQTSLHRAVYKQVEDWLRKHPKMKRPSMVDHAKYFNCCTILTLPKATFSKQQKDDLKSTEFLEGFREEINRVFENNSHLFEGLAQKAIDFYEAFNIAEIEREKIKAKKEKEHQQQIDEAALKKKNEELAHSLEGQVKDNKESRKSKIRVKRSHRPINQTRMGFFEGETAAEIINTLINNDEPIASVTFTGKVPNIYNPEFMKNASAVDAIQRFIRQVFMQPYAEYLIFTDPDPDGAHIRMQILALIAKYKPEMLLQERVFVIRAPYGRVAVGAGQTVTISNEFEGTRILEEGTHYVNSYDEMHSAMEQGALYVNSFAGAFDVMAGCPDIDIKTMLNDPKYKIPIQSPTAEELEYLKEMLTPNSIVKKKFTNTFYTDRKMISKYGGSGYKKLKVKTGASGLISVAYSVTKNPIVNGYQNLTHYNVLY